MQNNRGQRQHQPDTRYNNQRPQQPRDCQNSYSCNYLIRGQCRQRHQPAEIQYAQIVRHLNNLVQNFGQEHSLDLLGTVKKTNDNGQNLWFFVPLHENINRSFNQLQFLIKDLPADTDLKEGYYYEAIYTDEINQNGQFYVKLRSDNNKEIQPWGNQSLAVDIAEAQLYSSKSIYEKHGTTNNGQQATKVGMFIVQKHGKRMVKYQDQRYEFLCQEDQNRGINDCKVKFVEVQPQRRAGGPPKQFCRVVDIVYHPLQRSDKVLYGIIDVCPVGKSALKIDEDLLRFAPLPEEINWTIVREMLLYLQRHGLIEQRVEQIDLLQISDIERCFIDTEQKNQEMLEWAKILFFENGQQKEVSGKKFFETVKMLQKVSKKLQEQELQLAQPWSKYKVYFNTLQESLPAFECINLQQFQMRQHQTDVTRFYVTVEFIVWARAAPCPWVQIVDVNGIVGNAEADTRVILQTYNVTTDYFSRNVLKEEKIVCDQIKEKIRKDEEYLQQNDKNIIYDLRIFKGTVISIDGNKTKIRDDALSIERLGNGCYEIGVHIADVLRGVDKEKAQIIWNEAEKRYQSCYISKKLYRPMLPNILQNQLSLNADKWRYAFTVFFHINEQGIINKNQVRFERLLVNLAANLSTEQVEQELKTNGQTDNVSSGKQREKQQQKELTPQVRESIHLLNKFAQQLRERRERLGCVEPANVSNQDEENESSCSLVHEYMVLANELVYDYVGRSTDRLEIALKNAQKEENERIKEENRQRKIQEEMERRRREEEKQRKKEERKKKEEERKKKEEEKKILKQQLKALEQERLARKREEAQLQKQRAEAEAKAQAKAQKKQEQAKIQQEQKAKAEARKQLKKQRQEQKRQQDQEAKNQRKLLLQAQGLQEDAIDAQIAEEFKTVQDEDEHDSQPDIDEYGLQFNLEENDLQSNLDEEQKEWDEQQKIISEQQELEKLIDEESINLELNELDVGIEQKIAELNSVSGDSDSSSEQEWQEEKLIDISSDSEQQKKRHLQRQEDSSDSEDLNAVNLDDIEENDTRKTCNFLMIIWQQLGQTLDLSSKDAYLNSVNSILKRKSPSYKKSIIIYVNFLLRLNSRRIKYALAKNLYGHEKATGSQIQAQTIQKDICFGKNSDEDSGDEQGHSSDQTASSQQSDQNKKENNEQAEKSNKADTEPSQPRIDDSQETSVLVNPIADNSFSKQIIELEQSQEINLSEQQKKPEKIINILQPESDIIQIEQNQKKEQITQKYQPDKDAETRKNKVSQQIVQQKQQQQQQHNSHQDGKSAHYGKKGKNQKKPQGSKKENCPDKNNYSNKKGASITQVNTQEVQIFSENKREMQNQESNIATRPLEECNSLYVFRYVQPWRAQEIFSTQGKEERKENQTKNKQKENQNKDKQKAQQKQPSIQQTQPQIVENNVSKANQNKESHNSHKQQDQVPSIQQIEHKIVENQQQTESVINTTMQSFNRPLEEYSLLYIYKYRFPFLKENQQQSQASSLTNQQQFVQSAVSDKHLIRNEQTEEEKQRQEEEKKRQEEEKKRQEEEANRQLKLQQEELERRKLQELERYRQDFDQEWSRNIVIDYFQLRDHHRLKFTSPIRRFRDLLVHRLIRYIREIELDIKNIQQEVERKVLEKKRLQNEEIAQNKNKKKGKGKGKGKGKEKENEIQNKIVEIKRVDVFKQFVQDLLLDIKDIESREKKLRMFVLENTDRKESGMDKAERQIKIMEICKQIVQENKYIQANAILTSIQKNQLKAFLLEQQVEVDLIIKEKEFQVNFLSRDQIQVRNRDMTFVLNRFDDLVVDLDTDCSFPLQLKCYFKHSLENQ